MQQPTSLKYVFITASPVLTNEVRSYYNSLKKNLLHKIASREQETNADNTIESMAPEDFERNELLEFIE